MPDQQLEFDLVSPFLAEPTAEQIEEVRKIVDLPPPQTPAQRDELRALTARLNYLDLTYDPGSVSINDELAQLRVLIGEQDWRKDKKLWTRRATKDPLRFRKIVLSMKKFWRLT